MEEVNALGHIHEVLDGSEYVNNDFVTLIVKGTLQCEDLDVERYIDGLKMDDVLQESLDEDASLKPSSRGNNQTCKGIAGGQCIVAKKLK